MMNIYLIGMMGSGKSTVGKILSKKLDMPFLDLDHYIEVKNQKTVSEIFKEDGESRFREIESDALSNITDSNVIVACGGGIILDKANRNQLKSSGKVFLLKASISELTARLQTVINRPLLHGKQIEEEINRIWGDRKSMYQDTAHITVNTDHQTPEQIAEEIFNYINP